MMTPAQLISITSCRPDRAALFIDPINLAMSHFDIEKPVRAAMFIANAAHECSRFTMLHELWGPTAAQKLYEPPSLKATQLGNTQPGDGLRYRGHGIFQTTGRGNHAQARDGLRLWFPEAPDFEATPELLEQPKWAALSAGLFWHTRNLGKLADKGDADAFTTVVRRINGGTNGLDERLAYWHKAQSVLGIS